MFQNINQSYKTNSLIHVISNVDSEIATNLLANLAGQYSREGVRFILLNLYYYVSTYVPTMMYLCMFTFHSLEVLWSNRFGTVQSKTNVDRGQTI